MDNIKQTFPEIVRSQEAKDYTYAIMFFLISSFFAFFVIKPVLSIAIELEKERVELIELSEVYKENIDTIQLIQWDLESVRNKRGFVDEALPNDPLLSNIIYDIKRAAQVANVSVSLLNFDEIDIKGGSNLMTETQKVRVDVSASTDFIGAGRFIEALLNQRRIKSIKELSIESRKNKENEVDLVLSFVLEVYYLPIPESKIL